MKHCEAGQGKAPMILPCNLSVETKRARYTKDIKGETNQIQFEAIDPGHKGKESEKIGPIFSSCNPFLS